MGKSAMKTKTWKELQEDYKRQNPTREQVQKALGMPSSQTPPPPPPMSRPEDDDGDKCPSCFKGTLCEKEVYVCDVCGFAISKSTKRNLKDDGDEKVMGIAQALGLKSKSKRTRLM
jgi:hypothetical protein